MVSAARRQIIGGGAPINKSRRRGAHKLSAAARLYCKVVLENKVPLSRMTIQRRVEDLAKDANEQLHERLAGCTYFSVA